MHYRPRCSSCKGFQINAIAISVERYIVCKGRVSSPLHQRRTPVRHWSNPSQIMLTLIFKLIVPLASVLKSWNVYESFPDNLAFAWASPIVRPERNAPFRLNLMTFELRRRKVSMGGARISKDTDEERRRWRCGMLPWDTAEPCMPGEMCRPSG